MTRAQRFNARKDCLVCILKVLTCGHYDQGRDSDAKHITITFIFISFACVFDLPNYTSALMLMIMTAIMSEIC